MTMKKIFNLPAYLRKKQPVAQENDLA